MNTQKQIFIIVLLFFVFSGACAAYTAIDLTVRAPDQEDWQFEESVERGALLFANNCRTCHGNAGQGGVGPPLNREEFRNQDPLVLANNREMLTRTITCGRAGTVMPTWGQSAGGPLNDVQIQHIVDFLTAPATEGEDNEEGPNKGWIDAVEFAHNLNAEASAVVGGDTLATIADVHSIGPQEVADLNGLEPDSVVPKNARIQLPPNNEFPNGRSVKVLNENQTVERIANDFFVGAMLIADLNELEYEYDADTNTLTLLENGNAVPGLLPGEELELPEGATYTVRAEDTLSSIAEIHGVSDSEIRSLNQETLQGLGNDDPIPHEGTLLLPGDPVWKARSGDTLEVIAPLHGIEVEALAAANPEIEDPEADLTEGQLVVLPAGTEYVIQSGDAVAEVAANHNIGADELASLNEIEDVDEPLSPDVILAMPKIDAYVVQGQTLEEVADGYENGDAEEFATVNEVPVDEPLRVGTQLRLPEDVFGTTAPTSINLGTGCAQWTIPQSALDEILGLGGAPDPPTTISEDVEIVANSNDWTFIADGQSQPPNDGAVSVARGTTINFRAAVGVHTITLGEDGGDEVVNEDFVAPATDTVTFDDAGTFQILCDVHPDMNGWVFVDQAGAGGGTPTGTTTPATTTPGAGN